jgi:hypothetical protein
MIKKPFDCFTVYEEDDNNVFIHIDIKDDQALYEKLFDYFFSEEKLLRYCENNKHVSFCPSSKAYTILYRHLRTYIDSEREKMPLPVFTQEIEQILAIEKIINYEQGERVARKDKIGKIGEYIFYCLLSDYFDFDCILPKIHLQTDYNMSVYGIDSLFYSKQCNMLLFGESKFSVSVKNGVKLIKKSLEEYEKQIADEYELVLCNRFYGDKLNCFSDEYGEFTETCINIDEFIRVANVQHIGIPIFIAHGTELDENEVINEMKKIPRKNMLGLSTVYYCISLPVVDKFRAVAIFTKKIREAEERYNGART